MKAAHQRRYGSGRLGKTKRWTKDDYEKAGITPVFLRVKSATHQKLLKLTEDYRMCASAIVDALVAKAERILKKE